MTTRYLDILEQAIALFEKGTAIELEKRKAILSAGGSELQRLTGCSADLQRKIQEADTTRSNLEKEIFPGMFGEGKAPSLTEIERALLLKSPESANRIPDILNRYRKTVWRLKAESDENLRLLHSSARAIGRLLHNLQNLAVSDSRNIYAPRSDHPPRTGRTRAVLVNANA